MVLWPTASLHCRFSSTNSQRNPLPSWLPPASKPLCSRPASPHWPWCPLFATGFQHTVPMPCPTLARIICPFSALPTFKFLLLSDVVFQNEEERETDTARDQVTFRRPKKTLLPWQWVDSAWRADPNGSASHQSHSTNSTRKKVKYPRQLNICQMTIPRWATSICCSAPHQMTLALLHFLEQSSLSCEAWPARLALWTVTHIFWHSV